MNSTDEPTSLDVEHQGDVECSPFYAMPGSLNGLDSYEARRLLIDEANRWLHLSDDGTDYLITTAEDHRALQPSHVVDVHHADADAYRVTHDTVVTYHGDGTQTYDIRTVAPYDPTCMAVGGGSESTFRVSRGVLMSERPYRASRCDVRRTAITTALGTVHGDRLYIGHVVVRRGKVRTRYTTAALLKAQTLPVGMRGSMADRLAELRIIVRSGATEAHDDALQALQARDELQALNAPADELQALQARHAQLIRLYCQTLNACVMPVRRITQASLAERVAKRARDKRADDKARRERIRAFALERKARQTQGLDLTSSVTPHAAYLSPLDRLRLASVK